MAVQSVLEELSGDELTADHVRRRVDDWAQRIEFLYANVEGWLPARWTAERSVPVLMHEGLMEKRGLPPRQLSTLELLYDGKVRVRLRPYGLWIIGTNGRIDLVKGKERYLVIDHAGPFDAADWYIAPANARNAPKPFNSESLQALLSK